MTALATPTDVAARWRPLQTSETPVVLALIDDASDILRGRWSDIDQRITNGQLATATVVRVVAGMVRRAMMNRDVEGVTQGSEATGPFSVSRSFANPNGNLYLTADDVRAIDPAGWSPAVSVGWLI